MGTLMHPVTNIPPDGKILQIVTCPECGQLEVWAEWEVLTFHGHCRTSEKPPEECPECGKFDRRPAGDWLVQLHLLHVSNHRHRDTPGMPVAEIAAKLEVAERSVYNWLDLTHRHIPLPAHRRAIHRLYRAKLRRRENKAE